MGDSVIWDGTIQFLWGFLGDEGLSPPETAKPFFEASIVPWQNFAEIQWLVKGDGWESTWSPSLPNFLVGPNCSSVIFWVISTQGKWFKSQVFLLIPKAGLHRWSFARSYPLGFWGGFGWFFRPRSRLEIFSKKAVETNKRSHWCIGWWKGNIHKNYKEQDSKKTQWFVWWILNGEEVSQYLWVTYFACKGLLNWDKE